MNRQPNTNTRSANNYIQQLVSCLDNLNDQAFWQYAQFYGLVAENFQYDRYKATIMLLKASRMNHSFAKKELRHLGFHSTPIKNVS